jgi:SPP1 gp7 family putative phage head morphogenesis protein
LRAEKAPVPDINLNLNPNLSPLTSVLRSISSSAYLSGIKATGDAHPDQGIQNVNNTTSMAAGIDWNNWQPGDIGAAAQTADGALRDLLDDQDIIIRSILDTNLDRMGNVIGDGLARGASVDEIARNISDLLTDPSRAEMIATTEANRAQTAAAAEQLDAMGYTQFDWMAYDGACDECLDEEANNPHDLSDDQPPGHPNCRCAIVGSGEVSGE